MKAAWYEKYGPAKEVFQVGELDTPEAGPGEVRVRIHASGVNPSDVKARVGSRGPFKDKHIVPHSDGAGIIDQVGSGVAPSREGERAWVYNGQWQRPMGTNAEFIVLPEKQVVRLPDSASFEEGACLAIPAMTAHRCLFSDGGIQGQTVLVTGGAGAVGNYAVQLAKWAGAHVIATISSGEKAARARAAGASHTINYRSEDVAARIDMITDGEGVDRIVDVDFGTNLRFSIDSLKHNGTIATYASMGTPEPTFPHYPAMMRNINIRWVFLYTIPDEAVRRACEDITAAIEQGVLTHPVAVSYPLEETAASHEMVESGAYMGNVVVTID